jgi:hypothetical protein
MDSCEPRTRLYIDLTIITGHCRPDRETNVLSAYGPGSVPTEWGSSAVPEQMPAQRSMFQLSITKHQGTIAASYHSSVPTVQGLDICEKVIPNNLSIHHACDRICGPPG